MSSILSTADKIEEAIDPSLEQAEAMRQSTLKKTVEGKLAPQDQHDEPAGKPLAPIRTERGEQTMVKGLRSRTTTSPRRPS